MPRLKDEEGRETLTKTRKKSEVKANAVSPQKVSEELGCSRATIVNAAVRADVGVWVAGQVTNPKTGVTTEVVRLVALYKKDVKAVEKNIYQTPGNPDWVSKIPRDDWSTIKTKKPKKSK